MSTEPEIAVAPDGKQEGKKRGDRERKREPDVPIETLFDLTKPIPKVRCVVCPTYIFMRRRCSPCAHLCVCLSLYSQHLQVERPNKETFEKELVALDNEINKLKEERRKAQEKVDTAMLDPEGKSALQDAKAKFNDLKNQKNALIDQKMAMRAQLDSFKAQTDKIAKDAKDTKNSLKFSTVEEINKRIAELQKKQETTSMSLNEEKKILKEIDGLQASKRFVVDLKDKNAAMDDVKEQRKVITQQIALKDTEIDAVSQQMDAYKATMNEHINMDTMKRDAIQELFKERDEFKKLVDQKMKEKDAFRDDFRFKSKAFYNYQRAFNAQRAMQYEEEKKVIEAEKAARLAKEEEEEAKKIPYEEEQTQCEFLAEYLERTYLKKPNGDKPETKEEPVVTTDDAFAALKPLGKKGEEAEEYFGKGKGRKKRNRQSKKQDSVTTKFTLSVDMFEQFGMLNLSPPTSVDQVEQSVKELREKKEWYSKQERGSVPTAKQILKAKEQTAAKSRQAESGASSQPKSKGKGNFSLSNEDFIPLGAGVATSSVNASWGQKSAAPAAEAQAL
jgi:uncharacterized coiled-coil DUF342 family protein